ncbi:MAG: DsrE family protein [Chitinophagales bacterium]|nr:DsrE family protein [Chitinophagales bacterium]MDW8272968.1 DsrE family protein [Chitinophagales bacterium]
MQKIIVLTTLIGLLVLQGSLAASFIPQKGKKNSEKNALIQQKTDSLKIIFQLTTDDTLAHKALMKQLGNITSVDPSVQIEVVCHGPGLDMLRKDKSTVSPKIEEFSRKGIVFKACEFSMKERNVPNEKILPSAQFVKAGIIYIVNRQREGWSYIKSGF